MREVKYSCDVCKKVLDPENDVIRGIYTVNLASISFFAEYFSDGDAHLCGPCIYAIAQGADKECQEAATGWVIEDGGDALGEMIDRATQGVK